MLTQQIIGYGWQPNHWAINQVVLCYILKAIWMNFFQNVKFEKALTMLKNVQCVINQFLTYHLLSQW